MKDLAIFGAGGFGREVLQIALDQNLDRQEWNILGFLDENEAIWNQTIHEFPVLGGTSWIQRYPKTHIVVAVGDPRIRARIVSDLVSYGGQYFPRLIHPTAWIGRRVTIGEGTIICSGTRITTDIQVGRHVILNLNCTIGHDSVLEDFCTLYPGIHVSGNVYLEEGTELGTGTAIIPKVRIGRYTTVGAGAVVVKDLPAGVVAVGVPAKVIRQKDSL